MIDITLNNGPIELDAEHYVRHSSLQNNLANEILNTIEFNLDAQILDVGCGDGRITAELASRVELGNVLGIDASQQMIEFATQNFPTEKIHNLRFLHGMIEKIELTQTYDYIVSFSCFHWLKDPELIIRRLSTCLRAEGELLILTYPKESPYYRYLQIVLKNYPDYYPLSANHTMLSIADYEKIFSRNNFNILEFQTRHLVASYSTPNEIQDYIKGWLNNYVSLPEKLHDSFLQEVSDTVLAEPKNHQNGKIVIPYIALVTRVKKQ
jgi:trans-aconitate methyltransferase